MSADNPLRQFEFALELNRPNHYFGLSAEFRADWSTLRRAREPREARDGERRTRFFQPRMPRNYTNESDDACDSGREDSAQVDRQFPAFS